MLRGPKPTLPSAATKQNRRRQELVTGVNQAKQEERQNVALTTIQPLVQECMNQYTSRKESVSRFVSDELMEELRGPCPTAETAIPDRLELLLNIVNSSLNNLPPFSQTKHSLLFKKLRSSPSTVDCLLRMVVDLFGSGILGHPALELDEGKHLKEGRVIDIYVRLAEGRREKVKSNIDQVLASHLGDTPRLQTLRQAIEDELDWDQVVERYAGMTFRLPSDRLDDDYETAKSHSSASMLKHRLRLPDSSIFRSYRIPALCHDLDSGSDHVFKTDSASEPTCQQIWRASPDLWALESFVIACISGNSWNSAFGGSTVLEMVLAERERLALAAMPPPVSHLTSLISLNDTHRERQVSLRALYEEQRLFYRPMEYKGGTVTRDAARTAGNYAGAFRPHPNQPDRSLSLRLAKDITVMDARGHSTFWGPFSGNGPRRYRSMLDCISGLPSSAGTEDLDQIAARYGAFADLWCVCLRHVLVAIATVCMIKVLLLVRPVVILVQSDKITTLLQENRFLCTENEQLGFLDGTESLRDYAQRCQSESLAEALREGRNTTTDTTRDPDSDRDGSESDGDSDFSEFESLESGKQEENRQVAEKNEEEEAEAMPDSAHCGRQAWKELARGGFMRLVGDTFVAVYGTADNPLHAVALVELHCGHFAYRPIIQPRIHRLHALVCAKGQLALEIAHGRSPPATQQEAETLRNAIETQADSLGLNALILALRDELALLVTGLVTLQQLKPYGSPEQKIAQADVLGERLRGIRSLTLANSLCAIGLPGSDVRQQQLTRLLRMYHDAKRLGRPSPVPKPQHLADCKEIGDTAWMAWLDTRPEGTVLAESARSYGNRSTTILENLDRARKIELDRRKRVRAPGSPDTEAWTKGPEMEDVLKALSTPLSDRPVSGKKNKFYSIIECAECGLQGHTDKTKENSHYYHPCSDSSSVRWRIKNGYAQQLFFPMQLLWTGKWGMELHKMVLANEDEWYIEVCQLSEASEDQLISALQHKSHGARNDQWMKEQNTVVKLTLAQMDKGVDLGIQSGDFIYKKFATALDARRKLK